MELHALQVDGFRNLTPQVVVPGPGFNVLSGDNGQGKTNLLEAVYLLGTLRSFRTTHVAELIRHGAPRAEVSARIERRGLERRYDVTLEGGRRRARLDGKAPRTVSDYFGDVNVVLFAPEDLRVPKGSPGGRRRFLDRSVFNWRPIFLTDAQRLTRIVKSRNALLKTGRAEPAELDVYDAQLATVGARVVEARRTYLAVLAPRFATTFAEITRTGLHASLAYVGDEHDDLAGLLREARSRDLQRRQTTVGPHMHDLEIGLDGRPARAFASQGQLRALVLAWKIAEMNLLTATLGDPPLFLLDDVSSELDPDRTRHLFDFLAEKASQCFITTTHARHVPIRQNRVEFQVIAGQVTRE